MTAPMLNESFKALVRETFPDKSDKVISIFDEVLSHKASSDPLSVQELKSRAIDEIRSELATKDFVRAEIAEAKEALRAEIAETKESLRAEIAEVRQELVETKEALRAEIAEVSQEISRAKVDILKWVFGLQASTIVIILGAMKFILV